MRAFVLTLLGAVVVALAACDSVGAPGPNDDSCHDIGFCDADRNVCACGTSCTKRDGNYACEFPCDDDTDCKDLADPITGAKYTRCSDQHCSE